VQILPTIAGFPTIKFLQSKNGKISAIDYQGGRTAAAIVEGALAHAAKVALGRIGASASGGGGGASGGGGVGGQQAGRSGGPEFPEAPELSEEPELCGTPELSEASPSGHSCIAIVRSAVRSHMCIAAAVRLSCTSCRLICAADQLDGCCNERMSWQIRARMMRRSGASRLLAQGLG